MRDLGTILGEVHDYGDLHRVLRARREQLNISLECLDAITGLAPRFCSRALGPAQVKSCMGRISLGALLGGLAVKLIAVIDEEQLQRIRNRLQPITETDRKRIEGNRLARERKQDAAQRADLSALPPGETS